MQIKRNNFEELVEELSEPEILILLGPRQVGKSTLLVALQETLPKTKKSILFDLEQPEDLEKFVGQQKDVMDMLSKYDYVFIDEFYYLEDAGKLFKAIFDKGQRDHKKVKIIASGSSSIEIHSHLKESLAGRMIKKIIFPLGFDEYQKWKSPNSLDFAKYLTYGGLPGLSKVRKFERKQILLSEYLSAYILKDIKGLIKEENIKAFNHLIYTLAQNQGQLIDTSSLSREVGLKYHKVSRYLDILAKTYVTINVTSYHSNLANELKKSRKIYLFDLGLRNCILKDYRSFTDREDKGCLFETYVLHALQAGLKPNQEILFWRTKHKIEVDFILLENRIPIPIEVKSKWDTQYVPRGILAFIEKYPKVKKAYVISQNAGKTKFVGKTPVNFLSFAAFANNSVH